ncbi:hypothetical protein PUR61_01225 [Streptomyces sp. BE20]|uniref:hypothetical protein n=1 Tax=Streptomyces sp. BE20 TaxID=3002525 RepID=UPI002E76479C|nr:hypothetical protein [Streptomyces sp. BE20]MEE1820831.1 hypothetical protein [Streptomyces sp. BE20]
MRSIEPGEEITVGEGLAELAELARGAVEGIADPRLLAASIAGDLARHWGATDLVGPDLDRVALECELVARRRRRRRSGPDRAAELLDVCAAQLREAEALRDLEGLRRVAALVAMLPYLTAEPPSPASGPPLAVRAHRAA